MKNLLSVLIFISLISCKQSNNSEASYNTNEIIFVVEMNSNEGKSTEEVAEFSKFYTDAINANEPNSMGWGFYEYGDKIILIERYFDDNAMMQHGKNVSEGGSLEAQFVTFMEYFTINKIDVYGNASDELKEFVKPFGLPFYFHSAYAKFSRN
jgi:threonine synthase